MILLFSILAAVLSAIPAIMFLRNLPLYRARLGLPQEPSESQPAVSVLIPARDEEAAIEASVNAALASHHVAVQVVVLDDHSSDATARIVRQIAERDPRVKYLAGKPLPDGWNGKQFACAQLAAAAEFDRFVFLDADVRLKPDALSRLIARQDETKVALLSAFPYQQTETWLEKWLIPMMHFILLGYLPIWLMRRSADPAFAAGCGQLFLTRRADYQQAGTHQAIKGSRHDGIKLPRAFREAGLTTDVIDGTELAVCRMYHNAGEVIRGVLKNAVEGTANPKVIGLFTILLLGASVLPIATLVAACSAEHIVAIMVSAFALIIAHLPRILTAVYFRQSWLGACCHTLATPLFVLLQWCALFNHATGRNVAWRGRQD